MQRRPVVDRSPCFYGKRGAALHSPKVRPDTGGRAGKHNSGYSTFGLFRAGAACSIIALNFSQNENGPDRKVKRSEEHTSELQSLMRISYAVFCLKKKTHTQLTIKHIK